MKVRVRRSYFGAEGKTHRGQELEISESRFRQLTEGIHARNPLVDPIAVGFKMQPAPKNKMEPDPANKEAPGSSISFRDNRRKAVGEEAAKTGPADPTPSPPAGGQTGEVKPALFSEPDQAPAKRRSRRRAAEPE